jgi:SAM-dependent methyltransferase
MRNPEVSPVTGLLGDTAARDYSAKLQRFNSFAAPELRQAITALELRSGMRILDVGCGTGEALNWLLEEVRPGGEVVGIDLAEAHVRAASLTAPEAMVVQSDLMQVPEELGTFDLIWCLNTIHHVHEPLRGMQELIARLRPNGRIVVGQTGLLPDMFFAWDSRLERLTNEAVREYYWDRYGLSERDLAAVRGIVGLLQTAGLDPIAVRTVLLERFAPLDEASAAYISGTLFRDTWGERLRPYLSPDDYHELSRLTDPDDHQFALRRPDFHFLQTLTFAVGRRTPVEKTECA